jgi:hypothetical protein
MIVHASYALQVTFSEARQEQLLRHFLGPRMRLPDSWAKVGQGVVKAWGR